MPPSRCPSRGCPGAKALVRPLISRERSKHFGADIYDLKARTSMTPWGIQTTSITSFGLIVLALVNAYPRGFQRHACVVPWWQCWWSWWCPCHGCASDWCLKECRRRLGNEVGSNLFDLIHKALLPTSHSFIVLPCHPPHGSKRSHPLTQTITYREVC